MDDGVCDAALTFTSVDKILWCDHSNEISLELLSCGERFLSNLPLVKFGSQRVNLKLFPVH